MNTFNYLFPVISFSFLCVYLPMPFLYNILTIVPATINWTNVISVVGFLPLLIHLIVKSGLYKRSQYFTFNEMFDLDFFKFLFIGMLILLFTLFQNDSGEKEKTRLSKNVNSLKKELEAIHLADSAKSALDRESDKKTITDSINASTVQIIAKMQAIIIKQEGTIDSLNNLHEKFLTNDEKEDILDKILELTYNDHPSHVPVVLNVAGNANYGKFPSQLYDFLTSKGYMVNTASMIVADTIKGYNVHITTSDGNPEIDIDIGGF